MNKVLQIINLLGILALAVLCGFQWRANSKENRSIEALEKTRVEQTAKIKRQEKTIQDDSANLDDLRQRLTTALSSLKESQSNVASLTSENDQLKSDIDQWIDAVDQRDEIIKEETDQAKKLLDQRSQVQTQFNDLATKYNALVKSVNDAQGKH